MPGKRHTPRRTSRRRTAARPPPHAAPVVVVASALGGRGDALADQDGQRLYIPLALPGETVEVRPGDSRGDGMGAELLRVLIPSADRVAPPCPHFGTCGGCALQHMAPPAEAAWKRTLVMEALGRRGIDGAMVDPVVSLPPYTRRRATLGFRHTARGVILGFQERRSHHLVDIGTTCLLLRPELGALLSPLRTALAALLALGDGGTVLIQATASGADVRLDLATAPDLTAREALADLAEHLDLARLVVRVDGVPEPVAVRRPPTVAFPSGGELVAVPLPAGAFLQPSAEGEAALRSLVLRGLEGVTGPVADLFCGLGTFSVPLSARHKVLALDGDTAAIGALAASSPATAGRLMALCRDLFNDPLVGRDLERFAAVVLDPPRAGAAAQCTALATAPNRPRTIIMVSCNPATFARDARILIDGGYSLQTVTPVDQFVWSAHVELVASFRLSCS